MKRLIQLSFLITMIYCTGNSQTQNFTCGWDESSGQSSSSQSATDLPCVQDLSSNPLYIPSASDPIKFVKMNFHVMQKTNPADPRILSKLTLFIFNTLTICSVL